MRLCSVFRMVNVKQGCRLLKLLDLEMRIFHLNLHFPDKQTLKLLCIILAVD